MVVNTVRFDILWDGKRYQPGAINGKRGGMRKKEERENERKGWIRRILAATKARKSGKFPPSELPPPSALTMRAKGLSGTSIGAYRWVIVYR
jgi:hypothetical protein